jgi:hypothetical protein
MLDLISSEMSFFRKKYVREQEIHLNQSLDKKYEKFLDDLNKLDNIIHILIESFKEELYKEVKSMILIEFENVSFEIKLFLELTNKEEASK